MKTPVKANMILRSFTFSTDKQNYLFSKRRLNQEKLLALSAFKCNTYDDSKILRILNGSVEFTRGTFFPL